MKEGRRRSSPREKEGNASFHGSAYLYGIVGNVSRVKVQALGTGIDDPPHAVEIIPYKEVAALVGPAPQPAMSEEDMHALRRDMKAHAALLERAAATMTILPACFGLVFPSTDALLRNLLIPHYATIANLLKHVDGAIELTLRANYIEPEILREIVAEHPDLAANRQRGGYSQRLEQGRQIAAAIGERREQDGRALVRHFSKLCRDIRLRPPLSDLMVLNAGFLIERTKLPAFDRLLEQANARLCHTMKFECVGPLPPYSFVDLRIS